MKSGIFIAQLKMASRSSQFTVKCSCGSQFHVYALLSEHQRDPFVLLIRNLEVLSNEDLGSNLNDVGGMAAALQCQIWVQFDNYTNFCKALHAFCGRAMHKARYIMICVLWGVFFSFFFFFSGWLFT